MPPKKKKQLVPFRPRLQDERRRQNRFAKCGLRNQQRATSSYYNQEKWLKDDTASEKPTETTAKCEFHEFLSERRDLFRPRSGQASDKFATVPRHIKIGRRTFLQVYCSGRAAPRKTPGSGLICCRFFQGSVELLEIVSSKSWLGSK